MYFVRVCERNRHTHKHTRVKVVIVRVTVMINSHIANLGYNVVYSGSHRIDCNTLVVGCGIAYLKLNIR